MGITGLEAETTLDKINITCNKNTIPYDQESPKITSGIRIGSPAMTTRGLKENDFKEIGNIIAQALKNNSEENLNKLKQQVLNITKKYPLNVRGKYE